MSEWLERQIQFSAEPSGPIRIAILYHNYHCHVSPVRCTISLCRIVFIEFTQRRMPDCVGFIVSLNSIIVLVFYFWQLFSFLNKLLFPKCITNLFHSSILAHQSPIRVPVNVYTQNRWQEQMAIESLDPGGEMCQWDLEMRHGQGYSVMWSYNCYTCSS